MLFVIKRKKRTAFLLTSPPRTIYHQQAATRSNTNKKPMVDVSKLLGETLDLALYL